MRVGIQGPHMFSTDAVCEAIVVGAAIQWRGISQLRSETMPSLIPSEAELLHARLVMVEV